MFYIKQINWTVWDRNYRRNNLTGRYRTEVAGKTTHLDDTRQALRVKQLTWRRWGSCRRYNHHSLDAVWHRLERHRLDPDGGAVTPGLQPLAHLKSGVV